MRTCAILCARMETRRVTLETCATVTGTAVVIDVIRAFTTAAYAFAAGARDIVLVGTVEEALALRQQMPGALTMGEVGGRPIEGFDFGNSPAAFLGLNLQGRRIIQRTTAGTQGVVRCRKADLLLASSLVCASATARYLRQLGPPVITLVVTGIFPDRDGDEDVACADYLEALLRQPLRPDSQPFVERVRNSTAARLFTHPAQGLFPAADVECCAAVDRFDFAMPIARRNGLLIMEPAFVR